MNNNYGQIDSYGPSNPVTTKATGMSNPWVALAQFIVGRMAEGQVQGINKGYENQGQITGGRDINAQHQSPFGVADKWGGEMMPGAEKLLAVNWKPLQVAPGYSADQPTVIDSSRSPYRRSGGFTF